MKSKPVIAVVAALALVGALYFAPVTGSVEAPAVPDKIDEAIAKVNSEAPMEGIMMLRDILKEDPDNVRAIFTMGVLSVRSGQYEKAVARFKRVIELDDSQTEVYKILGDSYTALGDTKAAIDTYQTFLQKSDDATMKAEVSKLIKELEN